MANALVYSMNCDVVSLLTRSSHYLIWGGSWAIRRDVFDAIGLRDAWKGTLSDDLVASRLMRQSRLQVRFEPACVVSSPLNESFGQAMSFIRRQYLVARLYTFDWWLFSLLAATFSNVIWWGNLVRAGLESDDRHAVAVDSDRRHVGALSGDRLSRRMRQDLVKTYFPHWERASRWIRRFDIWANPLVELAHWVGVVSSSVGCYVAWRGIRYDVAPGGQVRTIIREDGQSERLQEEQLLGRMMA